MSDNFNFPVKCGYERVAPGDFVSVELLDLYQMYMLSPSTFISPLMNTSKSISFNGTFHNCNELRFVNNIDTSSTQSTSYMFSNCPNIKKIPYMDLGANTSMDYMFHNCSSLRYLPHLNTQNVRNMDSCFYGCTNLIEIPSLDTRYLEFANNAMYHCVSLRYIPLLDFGNMYSMMYFFSSGEEVEFHDLTDLGGFENLGKFEHAGGMDYGFLSRLPNLTHQSLMNVINNLYDRKSAGYYELYIDFGSKNLAKLTDDEISIAVNKGWVLI